MRRCYHDIKIEILFKLFKPMTKEVIKEEMRLNSRKMDEILEDFKERKLVEFFKSRDGRIIYHTTPKGRKVVKFFKDIMEHLEGKEVLAHVFRPEFKDERFKSKVSKS
jgi:predicted transcriptional regulator